MSVLTLGRKTKEEKEKGGEPKYPGSRAAMDGNTAAIVQIKTETDFSAKNDAVTF